MKLHKIELTGYCAKSPEGPALYLGTAGSYGNEQLAVTLGKGWEGLTVTATFQPAGVTVLIPEDGTLDVPWEATETALDAAKGRIVFEGVTDGRVLISTDIPYAVGSHSDTEGSNSQPPTPSEWEQFVGAVKGDANRAEQAAKDAEAALQDVKDAGAQAVTDIGAAKDSALDAIAKEGEEAAGNITADVQAAKDAAASAEQSAKDAAAELPKVQQAGQTVTGQITQTGATQVGAVQSAGTTQVGLVNSAGQQQAENIAQAGSQQVQAVQTAGNTAVGSVNTARDNALDALEEVAAHTPVPNPDTGKWQVWDAETGQYEDTTVSAEGPQGPQGNPGPAGQDGAPGVTPQLTIGTVTTLEPDEDATVAITGTTEAPVLNFGIPKGEPGDSGTSGSDLPATTAADRGKAPTVNVAGTGYELTGPYAPLSAAIIETAQGNPVTCEDSVEWGLKGLKVYGKSSQVTTTGAQLFHALPDFTSSVSNGLTITKLTDSSFLLNGTTFGNAASVQVASLTLSPGTYIARVPGKTTTDFLRLRYFGSVSGDISDYDHVIEVETESIFTFYIQAGVGYAANNSVFEIMLNAGSTVLPYEPYTGGKPSPSPEYPQEIDYPGKNGTMSLTVSNADSTQSQSLEWDTPNSLPGIPVDSGGNFVDADGQQWICNYRDYGAQKDIKPVGYIASYNNESVGDKWMSTTGQLTVGASVLYVLDTPIESPIPADELAAYCALHAYDGTTVVTPQDEMAEVEVQYLVEPKAYIEKKLTAIEQKIQEVAAAQIDTQTGG